LKKLKIRMKAGQRYKKVTRGLHNSGFRGEIRLFEEMKGRTSIKIGGPADIFIIPASGNDLKKLLEYLSQQNIPYHILGRGTNILVSDQGVRGLVIQVGRASAEITFNGNQVMAEAGVALARLARLAGERGLSGLEFGAGIPGTVGGAVIMNAGCQGEDISCIIKRVRTFHPDAGVKDWAPEDCRFGYRSSRFRKDGGIVLEAEFELRRDRPLLIKKRMDDILARRKAVLPLEYPSAGSIFKNPPGDFAGRLIDAVGLKGKRAGGAQISEKHANVIINLGSARATEVEELIALAREKVKEMFGVELELEIEIWS